MKNRWRACLALLLVTVGAATKAAADEGDTAFRNRLDALRNRVAPLIGDGTLLDDLHFGWFDRPYARATLATLKKGLDTLEREARLREHGNGALLPAQLEQILDWAEDAVDQLDQTDSGFRPHRLRVTRDALTADGTLPVLFGFVDATTATQIDREYGDLDLLLSLGCRIYARAVEPSHPPVFGDTQRRRLEALGAATIAVAPGPGSSPHPSGTESGADLFLRSLTLAVLVTATPDAKDESQRAAAVFDPLRGESTGCRLARRALARGMTGRSRYFCVGWLPPGGIDSDGAALAAAMWIDALEGQAVGLIRGWRDLRDGSVTPYPSLLIHPERVETVATTGLDLLRLHDAIAPFHAAPSLALVVGPEAVDPKDANAWADWTWPVWEGLLENGIRFDVVSTNVSSGRLSERYAVVRQLRRTDVTDVPAFLSELQATLHEREQVSARPRDADSVGTVYLRSARSAGGKTHIALVNLSSERRRVSLDGINDAGAMRDVIVDERIAAPSSIVLEPWQARLLQPEH